MAAPERKSLLLDLINTILRLMGYEPLADIEPMDRELSPVIKGGRGLRLAKRGEMDVLDSTTRLTLWGGYSALTKERDKNELNP